MSAAAGHPWTEHKTAQGRVYWYHAIEKISVWEKPAELKTARERALDSTPWKEYKSGDKSYYVHSVTKQSTWTLPHELKQVLDQYPEDGPSTPASAVGVQSPRTIGSPHVAGSPAHTGGAMSPTGSFVPMQSSSSPAFGPNAATGSGTPHNPSSGTSNSARLPVRPAHHSSVADVDFRGDKEAAEAAFIQLLENTHVDVDWTWEATMRAIITDPLYKALKSIAERKAAFAKYIDALKQKRAEEALVRQEKLKPLFKQAMSSDTRIKSYSSFATVQKYLSENTALWKQVHSVDEAKRLFEIIVRENQLEEQEKEKEIRSRNRVLLLSLLKTFEADVYTRWRDAHRTITESQEYADDPHLKTMDVSDMLMVFADLMRDIERDAEEAKKREVILRKRAERKNREEYKALLQELRSQGKIHARSTWGQVFALIKDEGRFLRIVGQPGSSPVDLLYDVVDEVDLELAKQTSLIMDHITGRGQKLTSRTTVEEFNEWVKDIDIPQDALQQIYSAQIIMLKEEEDFQALEERRKLERKYRHQIEDLRYAFKKVEPPLDLDADYDSIAESIHHLPEYKDAIASDEQIPRWAWSKFVRRQKEKEFEKMSYHRSSITPHHYVDADDSLAARKRKSYPERRDLRDTHLSTRTPTTADNIDTQKRVRRTDDDSEPEEGEV